MSFEISSHAAQAMMTLLKGVETGTDLQNLAVINRVGMAVASSNSSTTDATAITATASALIDLSEKMSESIQHGMLRELLIRNTTGYDLLMTISKDLMIFCTLANSVRVGYYLGYLRDLSEKLRKTISSELPPAQLAVFKKQEEERVKKEEEVVVKKPSANQDISVMKDVLGFLDSWGEREAETAITPELIAQARAKTSPGGKATPAPDLTIGISPDIISAKATPAVDQAKGIPTDLIASASPPAKTQKPSNIVPSAGIPQDLLSESVDFDSIIKDITTETKQKPKQAEISSSAKPSFAVYEDEVPPVPLEGLGTDSLQLLGSETSATEERPQIDQQIEGVPPVATSPKSPIKSPATPSQFEYKNFEEEHGYDDGAVYNDDGQLVDFESAEEYDFDLNLKEQDAMSEALKSLGWEEEKDKSKKKKKAA